jgi:hypothetical protein
MATEMNLQNLIFAEFSGATRRIRTDDLLITNKLEAPNMRDYPEESSTKSRKSGG